MTYKKEKNTKNFVFYCATLYVTVSSRDGYRYLQYKFITSRFDLPTWQLFARLNHAKE